MKNKNVERKRKKKLIKPGLQLRLIGSFVGLAALALLLQFLVLGYYLTTQAGDLQGGGGQLADEVPGMLLSTLGFSLAALLPIIFGFGILLTLRIAGPIYRFEQYLASVSSGEQIGPCKIRQGDELQGLCDAINKATEPLRQGNLPEIVRDEQPLQQAS